MAEYIYTNEGMPDGTRDMMAMYYQREEIVRCGDCAFAAEPGIDGYPEGYLDCFGPLSETWDYQNDEPKVNPVPPGGFCAWGVRRSDD